jgi:hypothetical protein
MGDRLTCDDGAIQPGTLGYQHGFADDRCLVSDWPRVAYSSTYCFFRHSSYAFRPKTIRLIRGKCASDSSVAMARRPEDSSPALLTSITFGETGNTIIARWDQKVFSGRGCNQPKK